MIATANTPSLNASSLPLSKVAGRGCQQPPDACVAEEPEPAVQVVGGLSIAQAKRLAKAGLRAFVISGNLGLPDGKARYHLPPAEIQRLVAGFIAEVSGGSCVRSN